jgi:purine-binding chemotaxis protein CheW
MQPDSVIAFDEPFAAGLSQPAIQHLHASDQPRRFVSFFLGENQFALPAEAVEEVTIPLVPTPLPDGPPALSGIAHLRGEIVAVVDLGEKPAAVSGEKRRSVILRSLDRSIEMPIGFNVDRAGEIVQIRIEEIRYSDSADSIAPFEALVNGRKIRIVETSRLSALLT